MTTVASKKRSGFLRRRVRQAAAISLLVFVILGIVDLAGGCYYSIMINSDALSVDHTPDKFDLYVETAGQTAVTIRADAGNSDVTHPAEWGIETPTGYGRLGKIVSQSGNSVTREFRTLEGTVTAGQTARLDKHAYPGDPFRAFGLPYNTVTFDSPLGPMPAWYVAGQTETWVIFIHGVNGRRSEALRMLRPVVDSGAHALVITYRNDEGAPADPSGKHQFGLTEWQDVEAAAHFARAGGAKRIVLVGYSMGGGVAMSFMRHSLLAAEVDGLILDAPMLDFGATIDFAGKQRSVPGVVVATARLMAGWSYHIKWNELDYIRDADTLKVPVLLVHGTDDAKVPYSTSESLAQKRPDIVTFDSYPDAQHVGAWNLDSVRYELAVREFLGRVNTAK